MTTTTLRAIITEGIVTVAGLNQHDGVVVAHHWNAVGRYLDYGDERPLRVLEGVTVGGYAGLPRYELETRPDELDIRADIEDGAAGVDW